MPLKILIPFLLTGLLACTPAKEHPVLKILPLGDSITEGVPCTYRYTLDQTLRRAALPFEFVGSTSDRHHYPGDWDSDHEGHSGWTTHDIQRYLDGWLNGYTPDVVLLHLGTNDIVSIAYGVRGGLLQTHCTFENSLEALTQIIRRLRAANPRVTILLAKVLPIFDADPHSPIHTTLHAWNAALSSLPAALAHPTSMIIPVDMYDGFDAEDLVDGVHPNDAGAAKMARRWADALMNVAPSVQ